MRRPVVSLGRSTLNDRLSSSSSTASLSLPMLPILAGLSLAGMSMGVQAIPVVADPMPVREVGSSLAQPLVQQWHQDHVLGTSLDLVMVGVSKAQADEVVAVIQAEIARLDAVLSVWRSDSEISRLNRNPQMQVSDDLFAVIRACEAWRDQTCGAFSARMGQLLQQWELAQGVGVLDPELTGAQSTRIASRRVTLHAAEQVIERPAGVQFAPDALAKGYVIDRAIAAARQAMPALRGLMVDVGGDLRVWGQAPRAAGWQVGVRDAGTRGDNQMPQQVLGLNQQALAFSGRGARDRDGQSHLIDPATGLAVNHVEQSVVVAPTTADADALATALAVMPPEEGMALIARIAGAEAQIVYGNGRVVESAGWQSLLATPQDQINMLSVASDAAVTSSWPQGYQAQLDYVIPKIDVPKYRAPYVVIWVTDSNKQLVRTLQVWGDEHKWQDSNYVWWRRYGRKMDNLDTVAKPSRQAGRYSVVWDGKDDQGKRVAAGQYQVHIESAREHGDHSYQSFDLEVSPKPSVQSKPAKDELGTLQLRFDRVI
jgi:thiamine biosynthesis lipoprotein